MFSFEAPPELFPVEVIGPATGAGWGEQRGDYHAMFGDCQQLFVNMRGVFRIHACGIFTTLKEKRAILDTYAVDVIDSRPCCGIIATLSAFGTLHAFTI